MQNTENSAEAKRKGAETVSFIKCVGSTVYAVTAHFSRTSTETIGDKILKLIESEARKIA